MDMQVIDCSTWEVFSQKQEDFFKEYQEAPDNPMSRLKDWPPQAHFRERLPRHYQVRLLCKPT